MDIYLKNNFDFTAMYIRLYFAIDFNLHAFTSFNVSACLISKFHFWLIRALTHWRYWPITTSMTSTVNKYHIQIYINVATLWNYDIMWLGKMNIISFSYLYVSWNAVLEFRSPRFTGLSFIVRGQSIALPSNLNIDFIWLSTGMV